MIYLKRLWTTTGRLIGRGRPTLKFILACGQPISLDIDPKRLRNHMLGCRPCRNFLDLLDADIVGPALRVGFKAIEEKQQRAKEKRTQARAVRTLRQCLNLSQAALARPLGVSRLTISRWEKGKHQPCPSAQKAIQEAQNQFNNDLLSER